MIIFFYFHAINFISYELQKDLVVEYGGVVPRGL